MNDLLNIMILITSMIAFVFILCPAITALYCISPLNKILRLDHKCNDYSDLIAFGLPIWGVIGFIAGWIAVIVMLVHK